MRSLLLASYATPSDATGAQKVTLRAKKNQKCCSSTKIKTLFLYYPPIHTPPTHTATGKQQTIIVLFLFIHNIEKNILQGRKGRNDR